MTDNKYDLAIVGAGPGGYVAAIRAAQLGKKVAIVDDRPAPGGTCLNVGCIPSKALLESSEKYQECRSGLDAHGIGIGEASFDLSKMMARKSRIVEQLTAGVSFLFKKNRVTHLQGRARFIDAGAIEISGEQPVTVKADKIIIATGSVAAGLPGIEVDGDRIGASTEALSYGEVPRELIVIGAGVIGLELGSVWSRLGSKVTVLEYMPAVLPGADSEVSRAALRFFKRQGINIMTSTTVEGATVEGGVCRVNIAGKDALTADRVLVAVGRKPNTEGLGLGASGVALTKKGFIEVDDQWRTSAPDVYAIGDVIGGAMLAHKASEEGVACVERIFTGRGHVNYDAVPCIVYTEPEVAWVGKTEEALSSEEVPFKKGVLHFKGNGRALALGKTDGFVKVLAHAETDSLLGVHIIGPRAGDILSEAVLAMELGAKSSDLARAFHAHPTLSEALKESALAADNRAIHA